jgi:hypothetical protein
MGILLSMRRQDAVLWKNPRPDGNGGYSYDRPRAIKVRWELTQSRYFDAQGVERISNVTAYTGEDLITGERLLLGVLPQDPNPDKAGALTVASFSKTPNLKVTDFLRRAQLS